MMRGLGRLLRATWMLIAHVVGGTFRAAGAGPAISTPPTVATGQG